MEYYQETKRIETDFSHTSLVNLHSKVAHPSCMIPLEPKRISYIHFPSKKTAVNWSKINPNICIQILPTDLHTFF